MKFLIFLFFASRLYSYDSISAFRRFHNGNRNIEKEAVTNNPYFTEEWFTQTVDHFKPTNTKTWQQRFQTNRQYYNSSIGGPVFLFVGGENEMDSRLITESAWVDYAKEFGGLCFQLEHRYYGKSFPTENMSVENMQYLTIHQALADLAQFISAMNKRYELPVNTKWIAVGCSYPGMLAAWLRMKYPHLVHGAVCGNGVFNIKVDYGEYFKVVSEVLRMYGGEECVDAIHMGTIEVDKVLQDAKGRKVLYEKFRFCDPIEESTDFSKDISNLYDQLARPFAGAVQFYRTNSFGYFDTDNITVDTVCNVMKNSTFGSPLDRLAFVNDLELSVHSQKCMNFKYNHTIEILKNIKNTKDYPPFGRSWSYQRCTEFGTFPTSSSPPYTFGNGFPANYYIQQCMDVFGPQFNSEFVHSGVDKTDMFFGGLNMDVTRVVFIFASIDPWRPFYVPRNFEPVVYVKGVAHCADAFPKSDKDPVELKEARKQIIKYIGEWLRV